jgi:tetratricopeptide (TPR) repeat protein
MKEAIRSKTALAIGVALGLVTLALYAPVLGHAFVNYDDELYVTSNPIVRQGWTWQGFIWSWTTGCASNWHPLTWLSHLTDCSLFGLHPAGHHATSALLHAANSVLLFLLLRRMTGALWRPALVAALFAWHPLHVESVAWVAERKDVLSTFFFLCAIWAYVRHVEYLKSHASSHKFFYGLSLALFAFGLMSKPMLVTLPFVLLLLDYWPLERFAPGVGMHLVVEKIPFLALSAASSIITFLVQQRGGAVSDVYPLFVRAVNATLSYGRYLGRMFWPSRLAVVYPYGLNLPGPQFCFCLALLAGLTFLAIKFRRRGYLATGWFWYLGTLLPVIGLIQVGSQSSADRYTYIPSIGIFIIVVWAAADLAARWRLPVWLPVLASTGILVACAAATEMQLSHWSDSGALFRHTLKVTTGNEKAWNSLGTYLIEQGQTNEALQCFTNAIAVEKGSCMAWNNLGAYLLRQEKYEEALRCFTTSMQERKEPVTLNNAGRACLALHRKAEAIAFFNQALALDPDYIPARMSLADCLTDDGRNDEAVAQYRKVLQLDPDNEDAHCNLSTVLAAQGKSAEAMTEVGQALRLRPSDPSAHCNLGNLLVEQGRLDQAVAEYRAALRYSPGSPEIHCNLGAILAHLGRRQEAIDEFKEALRLAPNFTQAKDHLKGLTGN